MLEKIGLPAKPSLRGNNWVVDSTHCQGCSSQFTFINRKHHCRRCGGLFCNSCTQQRMVLRGQGDSPVRICEPCKKLEEAARFELRHGNKIRPGKGSLKIASKNEDEVLNQILGNDGKESFSGLSSGIDMVSSIRRAASSGSCSSTQEVATHDREPNNFQSEMGSASPEELRQRALDEKKKYKILKGEKKSEEALRAFKRGKELEKQADALEISIRKNRKRGLPSVNMDEIQNKDGAKESGRKNKLRPQMGEEKDDFVAELKELGLSVMDLHDQDKKSASVSLEGELSSLLGDISQKTGKNTGTHGIDKTEVVALKKKALALKREGKLAEAKEELKKAKVLEKQLEEQELLGGADDSDDEISALIGRMDDDKQDAQLSQYEQEHNVNVDHLVGIADDIALDGNFEVTDEDMEDPEIAAALTSLGWTDDSNNPEKIVPHSTPMDKEALLAEILLLKREALNQKRAGNVAEAMTQLKKAKLLERDLESFESQSHVQKVYTLQTADISSKSALDDGNVNVMKGMASKVAPKSRLTVQKELLALKKKALTLRREGRLDEAEEELKKGKVLEQQLEEMDNASKVKATQVTIGSKDPDFSFEDPGISRNLPVEEGEEDVTDQDMNDPTYLSLLSNLGWNNEDNELANSSMKASKKNDDLSVDITESSVTPATSDFPARASRRSKVELQRELLGLKRKALALRRQGNIDEAEEVLTTAKALEAEMAEMEAPKMIETSRQMDKTVGPPLRGAVEKEDEKNTEADMHDPALLSVLKSLGLKDEEVESVTLQEKPSKLVTGNSVHSSDPSVIQFSSGISVMEPRSKGEIQRELLSLKRKALALRRKGETEDAEELLKMAKVLEGQMEELEAPKMEVLLDASKEKKSVSLESLNIDHEKHGDLEDVVGVNQWSSVETVGPNNKFAESLTSSGRMESDIAYLPRKNSGNSLVASNLIEDNYPLLGELDFSGEMGLPGNVGTAQGTGFIPPAVQSMNMMDLLTGEDWSSSQMQAEKLESKSSLGSDIFSISMSPVRLGSLISPHIDLGSNNDVTTEKREEKVHADEKAHIIQANSTQGLDSKNDQNSLRQEVLARKRKAVTLKREGKLAEAREELRQAKLLEKSLEEDNPQSKTGPSVVSISTSTVPSVGQKERGASNVAPKPLSGRDRFKLQQESLSHKRKALKLRREGRMQEAEAEFELAKALETQLEELVAHDSNKSSVNDAEAADDVVVEDLLDPQLLSALKAIGLDDASMSSRGPERQESVKPNFGKSENINQERVQLEEQIKAEKLKAVNLKRSGKQAEALDALRRAKLYEKKLNSLASN